MQYLTCVLKRAVVLILIFVAKNQVYAVNDGDKTESKVLAEGATAMSPEETTLYCDVFAQETVIACVFRHLDYFSQRKFLDVVLLNEMLEKHFNFLRRRHNSLYLLSFYDRSKIEKNNGVYLLEHDHNEIRVEGVPLPPDLTTFEYSLPSASDISIYVVSSNDDEVFNQNNDAMENEDSDGVSDSDFCELFVVISSREEPAGLPQIPASSGRQTVVGFMQTAPVNDSVDPDGKEGDLLVAPDWESLIAHLKEWTVGSLIEHLNVDTDTRAYLSSMLYSKDESDKEKCRKELITLLNRLMEKLPEPVRNTEETASTSEAVPESSPEPQPDCLCVDDMAENRTTSMDR